jgi:hypothetical protein
MSFYNVDDKGNIVVSDTPQVVSVVKGFESSPLSVHATISQPEDFNLTVPLPPSIVDVKRFYRFFLFSYVFGTLAGIVCFYLFFTLDAVFFPELKFVYLILCVLFFNACLYCYKRFS